MSVACCLLVVVVGWCVSRIASRLALTFAVRCLLFVWCLLV